MNKTVINCRFLTQPITGVQRYGIELTRHLLKNNDGIKFICVSPKGILNTELEKEFKVKIIGSQSGHLWEQLELPLFLHQNDNPILINFANTGPLFYNNNIVTVHDLAFTKNKEWFSSAFRKAYNYLIPRLLKKAKHIVTVSEFSKKEILNYIDIPSNLISVVYNGTEHLTESNNKIEKKDYYLTVGSLDPRKNLSRVIDAFIKLGFPLKIVGSRSKSFSEMKINTSDNIHFLGRVSDEELVKLYTEAKGFVYLSLYEGFGIPPIEAITHYTRPIVSDIEVFHEVLGASAIYSNPLTIKEIINTVNNFHHNSDKNIGTEEISKIRNRFSWDASSEKIKTIINRISTSK